MSLRFPGLSVLWRDGRPRYQPGQSARARGERPQDLKHPDGTWFAAEEVIAWGKARAQTQATAAPHRVDGVMTIGGIVMAYLAWLQGPVGSAKVRPSTRRDYGQKLAIVETDDPVLWQSAARRVKQSHITTLYETLYRERGPHTARSVIVILGGAISWAMRRGLVELVANPCQRLKMVTPAPRVRAGTKDEVLALIAAADDMGRPDMGDAIALAVWTGQRQGDLLALSQPRGSNSGTFILRTSKTGVMVEVPAAPHLADRLATARQRRLAAGQDITRLLIDERAGAPWKSDWFRHLYAQARTHAAAGSPSVATLQFRDLRDTAVTWLGAAGCTIPQIGAITGHAQDDIHKILKHYMAEHPDMAAEAIRKLVGWWEGQ